MLVLNREITKHANNAFLYTLLSGLQNYLEILHIPCDDSSATTAFYDSKDQEWLLETALKEGVLPFESELKDLESLEQISEANGSFVYVSYKSLKTPKLSFSKQFKIANKIKHSKAKFQISNQTLECELEESPNLKGLIAILEGAFFDTYPYIPILSHSQGIS